MLLSLPLYLKTPKSHSNRARYSHIIRHLDTTPKVISIIIRKLISYIDLIDKGIEILRLENIELCNSAVDRRAKKKKKRVKDAPKERLQDKPPAPPAPKPDMTPIPPKSVRDNGEPAVNPAPDLSKVPPATPTTPATPAPAP